MLRGTKATVRAAQANAEALAFAHRGDDETAIRLHLEAAKLAPEWHVPWLHLGAAYKRTRDWSRVLAAFECAVVLAPHGHSEAYGEIGLAATALGEWDRARAAWLSAGLHMEDGEGPCMGDFGVAFVRGGPPGHPFALRARRLDPVRARIEEIPDPRTGRRFGDVVLHDLPIVGERTHDDVPCFVFDELARLERSSFATWDLVVTAPTVEDARALVESLAALGARFDDTTASEGWSSTAGRWRSARHLRVAAEAGPLQAVRSWVRSGTGRAARVRAAEREPEA